MATDTSVLIVGGSLNGLTAALLLAHQHVACVVVERHPQTTLQYKFRGISPRSMEIYRSLGVENDIRAHDPIDDTSAQVARMPNLAAPEVHWQGIPWSDTADISPTRAATCDQDRLEPILRARAEALGADVRFDTELVTFEQDPSGVTARIRHRTTGEETTVHAAYLIATDGADSPVRQALAIARHGPGVVQHWMNVIFETDLSPLLQGRPIRSVFVTDINGTFVPRGDGRWLMAVQYVPEQGQSPKDFTDDHCLQLIRRGAGRPDVKIAIVDARPWQAAASVADRFTVGRVFLAGDSAHVMPPTGGFGGNTGIQDAHNLAWKLDAVIRRSADPALLDSYDEERRPVADRTMAQALARLQAWFKDPGMKLPPPAPIVDDSAVIFGYRYVSGAFVPDDDATAAEPFENPRTPSGRPGSRAPQLVVERNGQRSSTIDLFAGHWVLATGPTGGLWSDFARRLATTRAHDLQWHSVGPSGDLRDVEHRWSAAYGVPSDGAVLIRPDGFIAWRGHAAVPAAQAALGHTLAQWAGRSSAADGLEG